MANPLDSATQQDLQRESYHSTNQSRVSSAKAPNERAVIHPQDLEGCDHTLRMALQLWNYHHGPVKYNQWMSAFFALTRDFHKVDTDAPPNETRAAHQKRIMTMYEEI